MCIVCLEDDADGDVADILWKKRSSATPMATLGSGCSSSQNLWLVFGVCHLDNATVLSNIYTALCRHGALMDACHSMWKYITRVKLRQRDRYSSHWGIPFKTAFSS